jgi:hypothetical protein
VGQNPYPVEIADSGGGPVKTAGDLTFTDPGNQPGGSVPALPVADPEGVTVDTTTYDNPILGSGKLTTLVFPASETAYLAIAEIGDAFPRYIFGNEVSDGISMGDGTFDPYSSGSSISAHFQGNLNVTSRHSDLVVGQGAFGNYAAGVSKVDGALQIGGASLGAVINSGEGEPGMGANVGDLYIRADGGDMTTIYRCSVAGVAGAATWVGIL